MADAPEIMDPFDDCPQRTGREILRLQGYIPLPPAEVDDFQLRGRLWEFIYALAGRRFFLNCTNHLTERELYEWLYNDWLNEETSDVPPVRTSPVATQRMRRYG